MRLICYIISAGRPGNVSQMRRHLGDIAATWVVPTDEVLDYQRAGATCLAVDGNLPDQRNAALTDAFSLGGWAIQLDDDLRKVTMLAGPNKVRPVPLADAIQYMADQLAAHPYAKLAGVSPTENAYFAKEGAVKEWGFCRAAMTITRESTPRYDPELLLKEDWDFLCQHLWMYGAVVRCDAVLPTFQGRSNAGGVQRYRTAELEDQMCAKLLSRWPGLLRAHSRRPHELALRRRTLNLSSI